MPHSNRIHKTAKNGTHGRSSSAGAAMKAATGSRRSMVHTVEEQPMAVVCVSFAAGLAVGAGIAALMCQSQPSMQTNMQSLANRISDAVMQALPAQWRNSMT